MHILPSRGRPEKLQRFFDEGQPEQPGIVVLEKDQVDAYSAVRMPATWTTLVIDKREGYVKAANAGFKAFPNEPWYALSADDAVGRTPHWDTLLAERAAPNKLAWGFDGRPEKEGRTNNPCCLPFIGGDLCRAVGWFMCPAFWHFCCDSLWYDLQKELGFGKYYPDIFVEHLHFTVGKAEWDDTYSGRYPPGKYQVLGGEELNPGRRLAWEDILAYRKLNREPLRKALRKVCGRCV